MEELTTENEALRRQLRELTERGAQLPDLLEIRDRILKALKLGTQSPQYKAARKALDQFIREVQHE